MPCHDLISHEDIEKIYKRVHPIISSYNVDDRCQSVDKKQAYIHLYDGTQKINKSEICSYFLRDGRIYGTESLRGKVVDNSLTYLEDRYKRIGIGSKIHDKEKKIYKDNNFLQIHLTAMYDGLVYWPSKKFKFVRPHDETMLVAQWKAYVADAAGLGLNGKAYLDVIKNVVLLSQIDKQYLLPSDVTKLPFTEWLSTKNVTLNSKMYKNL